MTHHKPSQEPVNQVSRKYIHIQCVSVDSASLIIYPEIKATEVTFSALKRTSVAFISG